LSAFNHSVFLTAARKLAPRWNFGLSAQAYLRTYAEALFTPTTLSNLAAVPANFNDHAALLGSTFTTNTQLGGILTNSPLTESLVSNLLYGERMLTASATTSLSYSLSPRLSISFSGRGDSTRSVSPNQVVNASNSYVIADTTRANGSVSLSYSLSPLTQLGGSVAISWVSSSLLKSYTATSQLSLGRTIKQRWLLQIHGGVGISSILPSSVFAFPTTPHAVLGGSLGYKTASHTFLGSYDRTTSDAYGVGASTSSSANATWHWRPQGNSWWLESGFGWEQLAGNGLANTSGYRVTVGLNRPLGSHAVLLTQYVYMNYSGYSYRSHSGGLQLAPQHFSQSAVRGAVTWTHRPTGLR
jgi:hypothetical protein